MSEGSGSIYPVRKVPMRVVVCCVQRTGSLTTGWVRAFEAKYAGKGTFDREDWDKLLGDCQAVCDLPSGFFAADIALAYPDAKVVILNRDPEKWYQSVLATVYNVIIIRGIKRTLQTLYCAAFDEKSRNLGSLFKTMRILGFGYDHGQEKDKALAWYKNQYDEYRDRIPAERRIEYTIQDGWKPLCHHLGLPIPMIRDEATGEMVEAPFPHLNDREAFQSTIGMVQDEMMERATNNMFNLIGKLAVTGAMGYAGFLLWKTRLGGRV